MEISTANGYECIQKKESTELLLWFYGRRVEAIGKVGSKDSTATLLDQSPGAGLHYGRFREQHISKNKIVCSQEEKITIKQCLNRRFFQSNQHASPGKGTHRIDDDEKRH